MPNQVSDNARGILFMCAAMFFFVGNDTLVKLLAASMPSSQIMALRGMLVVGIMLAAATVAGQIGHLPSAARPIVVLRALLEAMTAIAFITALAWTSLAELTAVFLTSPLIMTAASAVFLKEAVGWRRWSAVAVGFAGMLVIVRPSPQHIDAAALLGLVSAFGAVARDLITRRIPPSTPSLVISLTTGVSVAVVGLGLATVEPWVPTTSAHWLLLAGAAVFVSLGNYSVIVAFRVGEVSAISPFRYTVILWALLSSLVIWQQVPDAAALAGTAIIVASGLYIVHRERVRARPGRPQ